MTEDLGEEKLRVGFVDRTLKSVSLYSLNCLTAHHHEDTSPFVPKKRQPEKLKLEVLTYLT